MLVYPNIDPIAIRIGPLAVHWYGLMYLFGFAAAWMLGVWRARRRADIPLSPEQVGDLVFYAAIGVIVGGRLGYVLFYASAQWLADPLLIFRVWEGGMAFHGGLLGVLAAIGYFAHRLGRSFFEISDFVAPLVPLGLGAGRIGNFINGELWGRPTDLPWGMIFPHVDSLARHPSQLYEAVLEGLVLFAVLWWYSSQPRPTKAVSGLFLLLYGAFRFAVEFVREPDAHLGYLAFGWLTMGQFLTLPMLAAGAALLVFAYTGPARRPIG